MTPRRTAFTLIEMVTSLVILMVLLTACASIVGMATRATAGGSTRTQSQLRAADAAAELTDDLDVATNFTERTATAATFTVPDRMNAGTPQVVSYRWSGVPGDPLTRQFNGGVAATVLPAVQALNLSFIPRLTGPAPAPVEQVIASHDAAIGMLQDYKLDDKNWASEYFVPNLNLGSGTYTLTRVRLLLKAGAQNAAMTVSIRPSDVLLRPTSTVLAQATVYESALSTQYEWIDVPLTGLSKQNPLQGLCIVLTTAGGSKDIGAVQIDKTLLAILSGAGFSTTTDSGSSWSAGVSTSVPRFYVFGTVP